MIKLEDWDGKQLDVVIHGDMKGVLEKMGCNPDLTFTSPPYGVGEVLTVRSQPSVAKGVKPSNYLEYDSHDDIYDEDDLNNKLREIIKKSHLTFWNVPSKQFERNFGVSSDLLQDFGVAQVIWDKPNAIPFPRRGVMYFHELIWIFGDYKKIYKSFKSVWRYTSQAKSKHPAPFPPELPAKAINLCTNKGDIVFDPFGGSGTTAAVAKAMGRRYITCDISEKYCEWMDERLKKTKVL